MNTNSHEKKGIKLPVPRLRGNGLIKQLCFAAALTFGAFVVPASANAGAPTLTVSGSVTYSTAAVAIAPSLTITGGGTIQGASVSIDSNFVTSEDNLSFTNTAHISGSYNSSTGILTFTGTALAAEYQTALRSVTYQNTSSNPTIALRNISISVGGNVYNKDNGHFYQVISAPSVTWPVAQSNAQSSSMYGLQGYLVTITSSAEKDFLAQKVNTDSWMGASDAAQEGVWRWVTGPEGLENSGVGRYFSDQHIISGCTANTGTSANGEYVNWNVGEPNNCPNENYGEVIGSTGNWNDLPGTMGLSSYIVEYGGMPGDPVLQITGSVSVNINQAPVVNGFTININENQSAIVVQSASTNTWTDADGDSPAAFKIVTLPSHGTLTVSGTSVNAGDVLVPSDFYIMQYAPTTGYHGSDSFSWNGSDGNVYAASDAIVSISVANQAPAVASESFNASENADLNLFSAIPAGFYTDAENDAMTGMKITSLPSNGTLWLNGQAVQAMDVIATADLGSVVYRPNFLFSGADQFTVNATDGIAYAANDATISVSVAHVNFAPTDIALSNSSITENMPSGTLVGTVSATVVDPNTTLSYTLVAGTGDNDNGSFAILSGTQLIATQAFNYAVQSSLSIRLRVEDANGTSYEKSFIISVQNANALPTDIAMTGSYIQENQPVGTLVGSFATIDNATSATFTYTFTTGAGDVDNASFTLVGNQLLSNTVCDFETKSQYSILVRSTDNNGNSIDKQITINVTDANDAPTDIALTNTSVLDNQPVGAVVGDLTTTDQDVADTHVYTLVSGQGSTDNASFAINGSQLATGQALNANNQASYSIRMRSTDAAGAFTEKQFTITAVHATQGITGITLSNAGVNENQMPGAIVGSLASISQDPNQTYTYSFVQGVGSAGNSLFTINGDVLVTNVSFDYETQNTYTVRVRSTNANGQHFDKMLPIIIRNVNDAPSSISLTVTNTNENLPANTAIGFMSTTDQDQGDTHTYTLVNGVGAADNASFGIDQNKLVALAPFDYEVKKVYNVRVMTTDSQGATFEQPFTINVTDVNEAPTALTVSVNQINENMPVGTVISSLTSTDEDMADTHTYTLVSGAGDDDNASFATVGNQLVSNEMFNYEVKNQYSIRMRTTDAGGLWFEKQVTINIINVNDAPVAGAMNFSMNTNNTLTLLARNFTFSYADDERTPLAAIRISSLPQEGTLSLNGRAVSATDVIITSELNNLQYTPNHNFSGTDAFEWEAYDGTDYSVSPATISINVKAASLTFGEHRTPTVHGPLALQPSVLTPSQQGSQKEGNDVEGIEQGAAQVDAMTVSNYPNPFANSATIKYDLPTDMHVTVKVYDLSGKEITTLAEGQQTAGSYTSVWNGTGSNMDAVSEGEYLYTVTAKDATGKVTVKTGKMVKMK